MKTNAVKTRKPSAKQERISKLEASIKKLFGHIGLDETALIEQNYSKSKVLMFEIVELHPKGSIVKEFFDETEFKPVVFPEELFPLLKRRDVFLATMGFTNDRWDVLYMGNPYR